MRELIISLSSSKKCRHYYPLKQMQRQEHKYRGFIKGNAHGIKWGREGNSDSRQTMMHFDPE